MSRNGAGTMSIPYNDFVPGTTISSSQTDANNADIVAEITNSLALDGQSTMSSQLKAADGSVTAPGYTFGLDANSGLYRIGADNIGLTLAGAKVADFATTGVAITGTLSATGAYTASGSFTAAQNVAITGDISPAQITANQNDYNPTGLSTASVLRLSTDASRDITGLAGGADGRVIVVLNVGSNNIVLKDDSASSTAANRFALAGDMTLAAEQGVILVYDSTSSRWRATASSVTAATAAEYRANTADKFLDTDGVWSAADIVTLTDGATITPDFSTGFDFTVTLAGNRTLANPTNTKNGQKGSIEFVQDGTGSRTIAFGTNYEFDNGTTPTLSPAASSSDIMFYYVRSSTRIICSMMKSVS